MATGERVTVRYLETGGPRCIAYVRLHRPPVNAIDAITKAELIEHARHLAVETNVGAVVIHGSGHFAAGDDIREMAGHHPSFAAQGLEQIAAAVDAIAAIPVPVIAAVTGVALGGGCELALAADFRIAAVNSTWGLPEVYLGLIPGAGGTQRLPRLIGTARAKRMIYFGDSIDGAVAAEWGLVDEAVPADEVLGRATALAGELCTRAPIAIRAAKQAIDVGTAQNLHTGLVLESALFGSTFFTDDARTGLKSFVAEGPRKATFRGR